MSDLTPSPPVARSPWQRALTGPWAAAVILGLFYGVLLCSLREKSATFDEPGHATAGAVYWKFGDYRFDPENGNLPQRWFGLALAGGEFALPPATTPAWAEGDLWTLADTWFNRMGHDTTRMLARGRAAAGLFAVALGAIVWLWARRLWGPLGGVAALLLYVTNPTVLAHGALMTSDVAAAFGFLLFLWCFDSLLQRVSPVRLIASGLSLGILFVVKMSAILAIPVALGLAFWRVIEARSLRLGNGREVSARGGKLLVLLGAAVVQVALVVGVIWASFGFRFTAQPSGNAPTPFLPTWEWVLTGEREAKIDSARPSSLALPAKAVWLARETRLLPEAYLYGWAHVWRSSQQRAGFLRGEVSDSGSALFFPYAFAIKTPLAALAVLLLAGAAWVRFWPMQSVGNGSLRPLAVLLLVYGTAAVASGVNLGLRHVLPVLAGLCILGGAAAAWLTSARPGASRPWLRVAPALLGALLLAESVYWFPHYLAYFNGLVSPARGYRHLVDSSLDWGQDLPALRRHLSGQPANEVPHLAYFGTASPQQHGITARQIYSFPAGDRASSPPLHIVTGPQDQAALAAFLRRAPEYDPSLVFSVSDGDRPATMLVKRAAALRLGGGTYYVSASLLQPVHYPQASGAWSARHEEVYQQLRAKAAPLLSERRAERIAALNQHPPDTWLRILRDFEEYRFARLTTWLRRREPDANLHFSILIYRLTDADLDRALNGPPP